MSNCIEGSPGHIWTGPFEIDGRLAYHCGCGEDEWVDKPDLGGWQDLFDEVLQTPCHRCGGQITPGSWISVASGHVEHIDCPPTPTVISEMRQ